MMELDPRTGVPYSYIVSNKPVCSQLQNSEDWETDNRQKEPAIIIQDCYDNIITDSKVICHTIAVWQINM